MPLAVKHLHSCPSSTILKQANPGRKETSRTAVLCKAGNKGKQKASRPGKGLLQFATYRCNTHACSTHFAILTSLFVLLQDTLRSVHCSEACRRALPQNHSSMLATVAMLAHAAGLWYCFFMVPILNCR